MNARILNVSFPLRRELFPEIRGMLVLDIFDDGIPAMAKAQIEIYLARLSSRRQHYPRELDRTYHLSLLTKSP